MSLRRLMAGSMLAAMSSRFVAVLWAVTAARRSLGTVLITGPQASYSLMVEQAKGVLVAGDR